MLVHYDWLHLYDQQHPDAKPPELSVSIDSISGIYAWPGGNPYQVSTSGLKAHISGLRSQGSDLLERASEEVKSRIGPSADLTTRYVAIYPDNVDTGLLERAAKESLYAVQGDAMPPEIVGRTVMKTMEGKGDFGKYDDIAILVNPNDPKNHQPLKGVYLAYLPVDEETHQPDFSNRILEKIADEDVLVKR
jgi:hypothetical protein